MVFLKVATYLSLCFFLLLPVTVCAQNLVYNGGFEEFVKCPERLGNFEADVSSWNTPTRGSTDYFNSCSKTMGAPENFNGKQDAYAGNGYAGLYLYAPQDYREYIQVPLMQPLRSGVAYELLFYISLADRSDFAVRSFGVLLTREEINLDIKKALSKMHLYSMRENEFYILEINPGDYFKDTKKWIPVRTQFKAKGTEQFLAIGNFDNNAATAKVKLKEGRKKGAYYYIDAVSLRELDLENNSSIVSKDSLTISATYELDKTHIFNTILFDFDTYNLLDKAKEDLNDIYSYLQANEKLHISIEGHTDNIGSRTYNQALSDKRCAAVASYFISLGLKEERISWQGHGGMNPITTNDTEEGRRKNRRVAFVISKPD